MFIQLSNNQKSITLYTNTKPLSMINIVIADDHPIFIDGIKTALKDEQEISIIGEALNGKQVLELLKYKKADIILLDINMPEMDGLETAEAIKRRFPKVKVIMLTQYNEKRLVKKCLDLGVESYLLKDCGKPELIKAIRSIASGGIWFQANGRKNGYGDYLRNDLPALTKNELLVLKMMASEFCNSEIAKEMNISINTVRSYKERLKQKSGSRTSVGLIKWAVENGHI